MEVFEGKIIHSEFNLLENFWPEKKGENFFVVSVKRPKEMPQCLMGQVVVIKGDG